MSDPWDDHLGPDAAPRSERSFPAWRVTLEVGGKEFDLVVGDRLEVVDLRPGEAVFGGSECEIVARARNGKALPPEFARALLEVKTILGGRIIEAYAA